MLQLCVHVRVCVGGGGMARECHARRRRACLAVKSAALPDDAPRRIALSPSCLHLPHPLTLLPAPPTPLPPQSARLAADVCDVPTVIIARTDALGAYLLTSDVDDYDKPFCTGEGRLAVTNQAGVHPARRVAPRRAPAWSRCLLL